MVLDPNPVYLFEGKFDPDNTEEIKVHENFADLVHCAESRCELCRFIRREFHYVTWDGAFYRFPEDLLAASHETVMVNVFGILEDDVSSETVWFSIGDLTEPTFEFNSSSGDKASVLPSVSRHGEDERYHTVLMRHWLTRCLLNHKRCAMRAGAQEDIFLPTRLIDVGTVSESCLNLILSADLPRSRRSKYTTLSYCWGSGKHSAITTALSLGERYLHIDMECLPKIFQDAIEITRDLGIKYIWIDALCIVQPTADDTGDWEEEIPLMGKVTAIQHVLLQPVVPEPAMADASPEEMLLGSRYPPLRSGLTRETEEERVLWFSARSCRPGA
jgi:hypothetical protein